ncbi:MAG: hypothetical protein D6680_20830 [Cyanobacteria bacterium J007]|nr:MAG: hypothetical protein D6680_20830 [Cyanobacteria bacterium J007]
MAFEQHRAFEREWRSPKSTAYKRFGLDLAPESIRRNPILERETPQRSPLAATTGLVFVIQSSTDPDLVRCQIPFKLSGW